MMYYIHVSDPALCVEATDDGPCLRLCTDAPEWMTDDYEEARYYRDLLSGEAEMVTMNVAEWHDPD